MFQSVYYADSPPTASEAMKQRYLRDFGVNCLSAQDEAMHFLEQ